ncbi:MAG: DUF1554 domain-containing protein, partial [Polyangiales bacterium]
GAGTDDVTPAMDLQYKLVWASTRGEIDGTDEIAKITSGDKLLADFTAGLTSKVVSGLQSGTSYAFAVVVRDQAGNETVYTPTSRTTVDETTPVVGQALRFSDVEANALTVSWGVATDNVTRRANLRYRLVKAVTAGAIDTIAKVDAVAGADLLVDYAQDVTQRTLVGLPSSASFAFAVVVRDEAGNRALYAPATTSTLDVSAPATGGEITFGEVTDSAITLQWGAASDDVSAPSALEYKVVIASTPSEIDSIAEVEAIVAGPALLLDYSANALTTQASGLPSSSAYAFAVVVRDEAGNRALYSPALRVTRDITRPSIGTTINFAAVSADSLTVQWGAGSDDLTTREDLQYKVVFALSASDLDTLEEADAIASAPWLVQDFTADLSSVQVERLTSSTRYAFAVVLRDEAGNRALYEPQLVSTLDVSAPTPGLALGFSAVTASSLTVDWGAATDDVTPAARLSYKLVTASAASAIDTLAEVDAITGPGLLLDYTPNVTTYAASGLTSSTSYAFALVVRDEAGNRALYAPGTQSTTDVTAPTVGSAIVASSVTSTSVQLSWGAATDDLSAQADLSYRVVQAANVAALDTLVEAAALSGPGIVQNFTSALTSLSVAGLSTSTSYAFAVIVRDAAGNQALYAPITQVTEDVASPTVGTGIVFGNLTASGVTLSWGAASDDVTPLAQLQYKLVRAAATSELDTVLEADAINGGPALIADYTANLLTASASGLSAGTSYAFAVIVRDATGNRALYTPQSTTTLDGVAPTPGGELRFSNVTTTGLTLRWGAASDNSTPQANLQYRVVRAASAAAIDSASEVSAITGADLLQDWTANTTSLTLTGLAAGTFRHYAVGVRDSARNAASYAPNARAAGPLIYQSAARSSANLGGLAGADAFCANQRDRRGSTSASVKAVLAVGNTRRACATPSCTSAAENVDWSLRANTTYYNVSGNAIGTTNAAGIFSFPLSDAWVPSGTGYWFTGLQTSWQSNSANCNGFTDASSVGASTSLGWSARTSSDSIFYVNATCSATVSALQCFVLCAEQ